MPNLSPEETSDSLMKRTVAAISDQFPYEGRKRRIELVEIHVAEKATEATDAHHVDNLRAQYAARTTGGTWSVPIKATVRLVDKASGKELDRKTMTLASVPKMTRRYSYIVGGHERQHDSVFRSKPRPYHRIANNGEIIGEWNLARGLGFKLLYDPAQGKLTMRVKSSNIPLYSVLRILGMSDAAIERSWGHVIHMENAKRSRIDRDLPKLFKALGLGARKGAASTPEGQTAAIRTYFKEGTEVWPEAMKSAFGKEFSTVTAEALMMSSKRLISIQRGRNKEDPSKDEQPDDRQALSSKYLVTTEDFIAEAISKKTYDLKRKILDRIDRPDATLQDILSSNMYTKVIKGVFEFSQRPDQTNPLQFLSGYLRTTIRGSAFGGVGSAQANLSKDKEINPTHLGFLDVVQTPESDDTGITLHLPLGVSTVRSNMRTPGSTTTSTGQELRVRVYDKRKKDWVFATPSDLEFENVAYPDQVTWTKGKPSPRAKEVVCYASDRRTVKRPWGQVRYILPSAKALFSFSANMIPFIQNDSGNRAMMAAKQQEQSVPLVKREAPLVQVKTDRSATFEDVVGGMSSHKSPVDGKIAKIEPDMIHIRAGRRIVKVPIYHNYPLNGGKGSLTATPVVRVGETVKKGQLIADTNFTKNGQLALGANLRVAYIPWKGLNFEDGIVVSESAAKRMASAHLHQQSVTIYPMMRGGKDGDLEFWRDYAIPERATMEHLRHLGTDGVVKEGSVVHMGDVLVTVLSPRDQTREDAILRRIGKSLVKPFVDRALVWEHEYTGKVVKVLRHAGLQQTVITVHIRTEEPLTVGDKLTGRHGNKGIVSRVVPDHKMPHDKDGKPVQVLLNPAGVPSRMNVGQVLETAASKISEKTGEPYLVENFTPGVDYTAKVLRDLKKHGLSDTEELFDPDTKRSIGQIMVGPQYMLKLHHMVEKKQTARGFGTAYSSDGDAPSGAGIPGGGQKMDALATYALLAHGAKHNLREAQTFKSDSAQDDVWDAVLLGRPLPPPRPSTGMKNFMSYLRAMGVETERSGDELSLMPLTDEQILGGKGTHGISNGEVPLPDKVLYAKGRLTLEEIGGLFDPKTTGGMQGEYWSHITLPQRMPNPLFEPAIKSLLHLTDPQLAALTGAHLQKDGKDGFAVLEERLGAINVDKELETDTARLAKLRQGSEMNKTVRRIRYLRALKKLNLTPVQAYTNKVLPVIPPKLRKVSIGFDGVQITDDLNGLYAAVGQATQAIRNADKADTRANLQKDKAHLYEMLRGLRMTGMSLGKAGNQRHHTGLMEKLTGKVQTRGAPKYSYFQRGVLSRRQDLSGRSTIVPEPAMQLDEVGIPRDMALEMYRPFVIRELVRDGVVPNQAAKMVTKKTEQALHALDRAIVRRPVLLKRDPALHKFSLMAFKARLVDGKAIRIHPLITGGFNADFDGDQMGLFVPVSDEAVDEARGMFPSKNLFSPTHYGLMTTPGQDSLLGIYQATKWGVRTPTLGKMTEARALKMMKDGKLKPSSVILLDGKETTPGRLSLAQTLPEKIKDRDRLLHDPTFRLAKKNMKIMLGNVASQAPASFQRVVDSWKNSGNTLSFLNGSSFSLNDFHDGHVFRDQILRSTRAKEEAIHRSKRPRKDKDRAIIELYEGARAELETKGRARYDRMGTNRMWEWAQAGARGNWGQFSQLVFGPMLVTDPTKRKVPVPITKSYGEGLGLSQYMASMHGARKGTLDRAAGTRDPGALTKVIMNTVINTHVTMVDCGTTDGVSLPVGELDIEGRFLAKDAKLRGGDVIPAGTLLDSTTLVRLRNSPLSRVIVRSPLHCHAPTGICAKCFGLNEAGKLHSVGTNVGVIAGHSLGEPVTQLTMRTFHTGGAGSGGVTDQFQRVNQLFTVPKNLPGKAVLARVGGTVDSVKQDRARGGYVITVAGEEHRAIVGKPLAGIVKGATVHRGQTLTTGLVDPNELLATTRSLPKVRAHLASEIAGVYGGLTRRRNIETVVKAMTNLTFIHSAPSGSGYMRGQSVPLNEVEEYNKHAKAEGREEVSHAPRLRPMTELPLDIQEDWMARLNYRKLKTTYQEGSAQNWSSNLHGHPIPGIAYGAEFGFTRKTHKKKK